MTPDLAAVHRIEMPRPDVPAHLTASPDEPIGCHLVDGTLFGTGYGFSADRLLKALDEPGPVDTVVVEHAHSDHFGALPQVVAEHDPEIAVPHDDQAVLPRNYYDLTADRVLEDGDEIAGFRAVAVPGHTDGNTSFVDEDRALLVVGDSVVRADSDIAGNGDWSGPLAPPADAFNRDTAVARSNLDALAGLDVDAILLTHGEDLEAGGSAAIETLLADLRLG